MITVPSEFDTNKFDWVEIRDTRDIIDQPHLENYFRVAFESDFVAEIQKEEIAVCQDEANQQHYEVFMFWDYGLTKTLLTAGSSRVLPYRAWAPPQVLMRSLQVRIRKSSQWLTLFSDAFPFQGPVLQPSQRQKKPCWKSMWNERSWSNDNSLSSKSKREKDVKQILG